MREGRSLSRQSVSTWSRPRRGDVPTPPVLWLQTQAWEEGGFAAYQAKLVLGRLNLILERCYFRQDSERRGCSGISSEP